MTDMIANIKAFVSSKHQFILTCFMLSKIIYIFIFIEKLRMLYFLSSLMRLDGKGDLRGGECSMVAEI